MTSRRFLFNLLFVALLFSFTSIGTGALARAEDFVTTWEDITITCSVYGAGNVTYVYTQQSFYFFYQADFPAAYGSISIRATVADTSTGDSDTLTTNVFGNSNTVTASSPGSPITCQVTGTWPGDYPGLSHGPMVTYHSWKNLNFRQVYIYVIPTPGGEIWEDPFYLGDEEENQTTEFDDGGGPGKCQIQGLPRYSVNLSTLNLVLSDTDFIYRGLGPPVALTRTYNTNPLAVGTVGRGWTFAYEGRIWDYPSGAVVLRPSGRKIYFEKPAGSSPTPSSPVNLNSPDGVSDRLTLYQEGSLAIPYYLYYETATRLTYRYDHKASDDQFVLTAVSDLFGNTLTVEYRSEAGREEHLAGLTDAAGRTTSITTNIGGLITGFTTPDGRQANFTYDAQDNLIQSQDMAGLVTNYTYVLLDGRYFLGSFTSEGRTTSFTYDQSGGWTHVASKTDPLGHSTAYKIELLAGAYRTLVTDPLGNTTLYFQGADKTIIIVQDTLHHKRYKGYGNGYLTAASDFAGNYTRLIRDARGNITRSTDPLGKTTDFTYNSLDLPTTRTDALGNTWTYEYDDTGNLIRETTPSNRLTAYTYNAKGQLTTVTMPTGAITVFGYDAFGNLNSVIDPRGYTTTYTYDQSGLTMTALTYPDGRVVGYGHDANGRLTSTTHPDGTRITYLYDCCAQTGWTDESGQTYRQERDALLRTVSVSDPLGNTTRWTYDANGNSLTQTNPLGRTISRDYAAGHYLHHIVNPLGGLLSYNYDTAYNLNYIQDQNDNTFTLTYDANGRVSSVTNALSHATSFSRDDLGRITTLTQADGSTVGLIFNNEGELIRKTNNGAQVASYEYNAASLLIRVVDENGTLSYTRDIAGMITRIEHPSGLRLNFTYDSWGRPATITYPGGLTLTHTYNQRGALARLAWSGAHIAFSYDSVSRLTGEARSNNTTSAFTYNAAGRLLHLLHQRPSGAIADLRYTLNALGQVNALSGQLPLDPDPTAFDHMDAAYGGNEPYHYNGHPAINDANGNLAGLGVNPPSASFSHSPENQLTAVEMPSLVATYRYNGLGHRVRAERNGEIRQYLHGPGGRVLVETDGSGNILTSYIWAGPRLVAFVRSGKSYFLHGDHQLNTLAVTDGNGLLVASYAYFPFGGLAATDGSLENRFTFGGGLGVTQEGEDMFFMKARYYHVGLRRFLETDPLGLDWDPNLFVYASDDPVNRVDPTGEQGWETVLILGALTAAYSAYTWARDDVPKTYQRALEAETSSNEFSARRHQMLMEGRMRKKGKDFCRHPSGMIDLERTCDEYYRSREREKAYLRSFGQAGSDLTRLGVQGAKTVFTAPTGVPSAPKTWMERIKLWVGFQDVDP